MKGAGCRTGREWTDPPFPGPVRPVDRSREGMRECGSRPAGAVRIVRRREQIRGRARCDESRCEDHPLRQHQAGSHQCQRECQQSPGRAAASADFARLPCFQIPDEASSASLYLRLRIMQWSGAATRHDSSFREPASGGLCHRHTHPCAVTIGPGAHFCRSPMPTTGRLRHRQASAHPRFRRLTVTAKGLAKVQSRGLPGYSGYCTPPGSVGALTPRPAQPVRSDGGLRCAWLGRR